ncbi:MAG: hypothetical protein J6A63_10015 [Clostridia bacterium]|nr:hypothetical protein [Clostridia bacterium]
MKQAYDIVILAGQSNAEGCGVGDVEQEYIPDERICALQAEMTVEHRPDNVYIQFADKPFVLSVAKEKESDGKKYGNFSLTFGKEYVESGRLKDGRKLLIVRIGVGGTGFYKKQWGLQDILYKKMIEMVDYALSLNAENKVVALLWHQGEHDAFEGTPPKAYGKQLSALIGDVRKRYGQIPFIAGDFVRDWKGKNISSCQPIVDEIRAVTQTVGKAGFVETSDLPSNDEQTQNGDDIHFCRQSLHVLGRRYFAAYKEIANERI